jgi:hypothetical protein
MKHLVLAALLAWSGAAFATKVDRQIWLQTVAEVPVGGPVSAFGGIYLRYSDGAARLGTRYLLGGLGFDLGRDVELGLGYANLRSRAGDRFAYENRLFQQLSYPVVAGRRASIEGRTRLEQRFFSIGGSGGQLRARQRMEVVVPFGESEGPAFKTSGELFMTLVGPADTNDVEFDQFRGFAGVMIPLGPFELDIGYKGQRRDEPDRRNDILFIGADIDF